MDDFRLLHRDMYYIWNRIVNVIFIRQYNALKRSSREEILRQWYDLNTIYYPARVKGIIKTKYVDSWYRGKFRYGNNHFPLKTKTLQRKHLR